MTRLEESVSTLPWDHPGPVWARLEAPCPVAYLRAEALARGRTDLVVLGSVSPESPPEGMVEVYLALEDLLAADPQAFQTMCYQAHLASHFNGGRWIEPAQALLPLALEVYRTQGPATLEAWAQALSAESLFGPLDGLTLDRLMARAAANPLLAGYVSGLRLPGGDGGLANAGHKLMDRVITGHRELEDVFVKPMLVLEATRRSDDPRRPPVPMPWARALRENRMVVTLSDQPLTGGHNRVLAHLAWLHATWSLQHDPEVRFLAGRMDPSGRPQLLTVEAGPPGTHLGWDTLGKALEQVVLEQTATSAMQDAGHDPTAPPRRRI